MPDTIANIRVEVRHGREAAQAFRHASVEVGQATRDVVRYVGEVGEGAYRREAPVATGLLKASIARVEVNRGDQITIVVGTNARDPKTGFDYVPITRFGHKVARIYPRFDRAPASVIETKRPRAVGPAAALRFEIGGEVMFRRSVRGYHPAVDWATRADVVIDAALAIAGARVHARVDRAIQK